MRFSSLRNKAGITLLQGLQAAEATLTTRLWRDAMLELQHHIAQGRPLHQALRDHALFKPLCMQLVHVVEEADALGYHADAPSGVARSANAVAGRDTLAASLEPVIIVVIGVIVDTLVRWSSRYICPCPGWEMPFIRVREAP